MSDIYVFRQKLLFFVRIVNKFTFIGLLGSIISVFLGEKMSNMLSHIFSHHPIHEFPNTADLIISSGPLIAFFNLTIWAPLIEETVFRYWIKCNRYRLHISLTGLVILLLLHNHPIRRGFYGTFTIIVLYITASYVVFSSQKWFSKLQKVDSKLLIFISGTAFGLAHLPNFDLTQNAWYICLPLILPQIFTGFLFGYIRVTYGMRYNIFTHSAINLISFIAGYIFI